jgi:hypothetical protein
MSFITFVSGTECTGDEFFASLNLHSSPLSFFDFHVVDIPKHYEMLLF